MNTHRNAAAETHEVRQLAANDDEVSYRATMHRIRSEHRAAVLRLAIHNEIYRQHNDRKRAMRRILENDISRLEHRYQARFGTT